MPRRKYSLATIAVAIASLSVPTSVIAQSAAASTEVAAATVAYASGTTLAAYLGAQTDASLSAPTSAARIARGMHNYNASSVALYVSNSNGNTITEYDIETGALIRTVVKAGPELKGSKGIAFDSEGNLYVAGRYSNSVVKYNRQTGQVLSVLDPKHKGQISGPQGLNFGPDGKLYVASSDNDRIVKLDPATGNYEGTLTTVAVPGAEHTLPIDPYFGPDGSLYIGTFSGHKLLKYQGPEASGTEAAVAEKKPKPGTLLATFEDSRPGVSNMSVAKGHPTFYFSDVIDPVTFSGSVAQYTLDGKFVRTLVPTGTGGMRLPGGIAAGPDGNLYVASVKLDQNFKDSGSTILKFNPSTGELLGELVGTGHGLDVPFAMAVGPR